MRARRDVPAHVFVVVPPPAPSLGAVEEYGESKPPPSTPASTTPGAVAATNAQLLGVNRSPGLHRRPSAHQFQGASGAASSEDEWSAPASPSAGEMDSQHKPVTNVAFVMGTFFSWSGECSSRIPRRFTPI